MCFFPVAIHEAKTIEGALDIIDTPKLFEYRPTLLPEVPLELAMADVRNHSASDHREVVLVTLLS